eukprot:jgi/Chlat1/6504/Chrsp45S05998
MGVNAVTVVVSEAAADTSDESSDSAEAEAAKPSKQQQLRMHSLSDGLKSGSLFSLGGSSFRKSVFHFRDSMAVLGGKLRSTSSNSSNNAPGVKKLSGVRGQLKLAFKELYRALEFLYNFSALNALGISKILKKHDKLFGSCGSTRTVYMAAKSTRVQRVMRTIEADFASRFEGNDHKQAMRTLKPEERKTGQLFAFVLGGIVGFEVCLVMVLLVINYTSRGTSAGGPFYTEAVFPFYRGFILLMLHLYLYGVNLVLFTRCKINYPFIFDFHVSTALRPQEVLFFVAACSAPLLGGQALQVLIQSSSNRFHLGAASADIIPVVLLGVYFLVLLYPFNVFYRSSRLFFLRTLYKLLTAPCHRVRLADFFLGDQLTSQVRFLYDLQFSVCYYFSGEYATRNFRTIQEDPVFKDFSYIVGCLPFFCRAMQCLRRFYDEKDRKHLANLMKYALAMLVIITSLLYHDKDGKAFVVMFVFASVCATCYSYYWDVTQDWGLLNRRSSNPWLRDDLILPRSRRWVYYVALVLNLLMRLLWISSIIPITSIIKGVNYQVLVMLFAAVEVIRRNIWIFFRIENEHLNNCGNFRAVKQVPLPLNRAHLD